MELGVDAGAKFLEHCLYAAVDVAVQLVVAREQRDFAAADLVAQVVRWRAHLHTQRFQFVAERDDAAIVIAHDADGLTIKLEVESCLGDLLARGRPLVDVELLLP